MLKGATGSNKLEAFIFTFSHSGLEIPLEINEKQSKKMCNAACSVKRSIKYVRVFLYSNGTAL